MRTIYLIRHGEPCRDGTSCCISRMEEHLSAVGREQAEALGKWFDLHTVSCIYSSPQKRCLETASVMAGEMKRIQKPAISIQADLAEISVGSWDGLSFAEIKERWPEEYMLRGRHPGTVSPPGGENFFQAGERLGKVLLQILKETEGDVAVLTHSGLLRGWLYRCLKIREEMIFSTQIPFGSITRAEFDGRGFIIKELGKKPKSIPGPLEMEALFRKYETPEMVREHGYRVAEKAVSLAENIAFDRELLTASCILHDLCRTSGRNHPEMAAEVLKRAGYPELARIIRHHHDLEPGSGAEEELLYLADKLIRGTEEVTLSERFEDSRQKCRDEAALSAWKQRYEAAERLMEKYGVR